MRPSWARARIAEDAVAGAGISSPFSAMLFFSKQLLKGLLMPVPALLMIGGIGLILLWRDRRPRLGRILVSGSLFLLILLSFPPFPNALGRPLEREYPAYQGQAVDFFFALVTSATHMARAVTIFRDQGLAPIPAPTGHLVRVSENLNLLDFLPSSTSLRISRQIWYEFLGSVWNRIRP